jgi:hypothetical protein
MSRVVPTDMTQANQPLAQRLGTSRAHQNEIRTLQLHGLTRCLQAKGIEVEPFDYAQVDVLVDGELHGRTDFEFRREHGYGAHGYFLRITDDKPDHLTSQSPGFAEANIICEQIVWAIIGPLFEAMGQIGRIEHALEQKAAAMDEYRKFLREWRRSMQQSGFSFQDFRAPYLQMYREAQRLSASGVCADSLESQTFRTQELELANADVCALEALGPSYLAWKQSRDDEFVSSAKSAADALRIAVENARSKIQNLANR